jgi:hypothetical protein
MMPDAAASITDDVAAPMRDVAAVREGDLLVVVVAVALDSYVLLNDDHSSVIVILNDFGRRPVKCDFVDMKNR